MIRPCVDHGGPLGRAFPRRRSRPSPTRRAAGRRRRRRGRASATCSPSLPGVHRGALLDVVRLEPVAGHLVEQHAAEAAADHDRHRAGRRRVGVEERQRHLRALARRSARRRRLGDQLEATMAAERLEAGLDGAVSRRATTWTPSRTRVRSSAANRPTRVGDGDQPAPLRVARLDLGDLGAGGPRGLVAGAKELGLALGRDLGRRDLDLLERRARPGSEAPAARGARPERRRRPRRRRARGRASPSPSTWAK